MVMILRVRTPRNASRDIQRKVSWVTLDSSEINSPMTYLHIKLASCLVIVMASLLSVAPVNGQSLPLEALVERADAIIQVEVNFVPYGDLVLLVNVLRGDQTALPEMNGLLGPCMPGRAALRALREAVSENDIRAPVYREAFESATYIAVVFLVRAGETFEPICGNGGHSTENWVSDPRYALWRKQLDAIMNE